MPVTTGNVMMSMVSGEWRMIPKQIQICVLIIVRTSNGLLWQFKYIVTENVTKMKLGSVADTQANILLWIETLLLFDRTENNIANFQYKVIPYNDFATDGLRFAVCNDDVCRCRWKFTTHSNVLETTWKKDRNKMWHWDYCSDHQPLDCRSPT